jgi:hypothetical protein
MGAKLIPGWPTTGPESFALLMNHPDAEVQLTGMQKLRSLPDYHPQVPTAPAQVAVPYADDY